MIIEVDDAGKEGGGAEVVEQWDQGSPVAFFEITLMHRGTRNPSWQGNDPTLGQGGY